MIRIDAIWLATELMDMRAGPDTALARVVQVFGEARMHHAGVVKHFVTTQLSGLPHFNHC